METLLVLVRGSRRSTGQHREIETECAQMKKQLVDLQDVLATVTRDATENSRRAAEMQRSRDELKRALEMAELKVQVRPRKLTPPTLRF
nr:unnamed protein product [Haemonchus contortus]